MSYQPIFEIPLADVSDIILRTEPPYCATRRNGVWQPEQSVSALTEGDIFDFIGTGVDNDRLDNLKKSLRARARSDFQFKLQACRTRGSLLSFGGNNQNIGLVLRILPPTPPEFNTLGFIAAATGMHPGGDDQSILKWLRQKSGLVLVTGATGSGKTTTLASMVNYINKNIIGKHIITLEAPVEIVHTPHAAIITQQEIPRDETGFAEALRNALRRAPDIIVIGEINDSETAAEALRAAETGHLVLATLHTRSAVETLDRLIALLPPERRDWCRDVLGNSLLGIISQTLFPSLAADKTRALIYELLVANASIKNAVKNGRNQQITSEMDDLRAQAGTSRPLKLILRALIDAGTVDKNALMTAGFDIND